MANGITLIRSMETQQSSACQMQKSFTGMEERIFSLFEGLTNQIAALQEENNALRARNEQNRLLDEKKEAAHVGEVKALRDTIMDLTSRVQKMEDEQLKMGERVTAVSTTANTALHRANTHYHHGDRWLTSPPIS